MAVLAAPAYANPPATAVRVVPADHSRRWGAPIWQADQPIDQPERLGQTQPSLHPAALAIILSQRTE